MAYMPQEKKAEIAKKVKPLLAKYGLKGTLSVRNHSTLCLTIRSGKIDFAEAYRGAYHDGSNYFSVNHYYINETFEGIAAEALTALKDAMMETNYDNSDSQTDYFDVGWYINITVGKFAASYELV